MTAPDDASRFACDSLLARLDPILSQTDAVLFALTPKPPHRITFISNGIRRLVGFSAEAFRHQPELWGENVHPLDRSGWEERIGIAAQIGGSVKREYRFRGKDGVYRWLRDELTVRRDASGKVVEIVGFCTDIDAQKAAEKERSEAEKRHNELICAMPVLFCESLPDTTLLWVNPAYARQIGVPAADLPGRRFIDFIPESERPGVLARLGSLTPERPTLVYEHLVDAAGRQRWFRWTDHAFFDETGTMTSFQSIGFDVTREVETESAVRVERDRAQSYLDVAKVMFIGLDTRGRVSLVNKETCRVLGYSSAELMGKDWIEMVNAPDVRDRSRTLLNEILAGGVDPRSDMEIALATKSGETRVTRWKAALLRVDGAVTGLLASGEDVTEHTRLMAELESREAFYRAVFENDGVSIWIMNDDGYIEQANRTFRQQIDEAATDLRGRRLYEFVSASAHNALRQGFLTSVASGGSRNLEVPIRTADGATRYLEISLSRLDAGGGRRRVLAIGVDVTQERADDRARNDAFVRQTAILNNIPDIAWLKDEEGRYILVNGQFGRATGKSPEDVIGKTDFDCWPRDLAARYQADDRDVMKSRRQMRVEEPLVDAAGTENIFETIKRPVIDAAGHVIGTTGIAREITDRKRIEQALQASEERFRSMVENVPGAIYRALADADWTLLFVNDFIEEITGYPARAFVERRQSLAGLIHQDDFARANAAVQRAAATCGRYEIEYRIRHRDGSERWVFDKGRAVCDDSGVRWLDGSIFDRTEQKRAADALAASREQLFHSSKMEAIGRLAGGIAHDFNNILSAILGYSEFLLADLPEQDSRHNDANQIRLAAQRASDLTRQLLAFGRKQVVQPDVFDLNGVLRGFDKLLRRTLGEDIDVVFHLSDDPCFIKADKGQIEQMILNLAINARDAMPKGGRLTIKTETVGARRPTEPNASGARRETSRAAKMTVSDNGIGMDASIIEHIFEPFFTTKAKGKGTGLGLATVYGMVTQLAGRIDVESAPGAGATFSILLPLERKAAPPSKAPAMGGAELAGRERILLVEDEAAVRRMATRILRNHGYDVLEAAGPAEALRLSSDDGVNFDMIVTDVVMPGMNGKEMVDEIQSRRPPLPVLFVSGYPSEILGLHGILEKNTNFLHKPFSSHSLLEKVKATAKAVAPPSAPDNGPTASQ